MLFQICSVVNRASRRASTRAVRDGFGGRIRQGWDGGIARLLAGTRNAGCAGRLAAAAPDRRARSGRQPDRVFPWVNQFPGSDEPLRNCSRDRIWCAELIRPRTGADAWVVQVVARATDREPAERRWRYTLPAALLRGRSPAWTLWQDDRARWVGRSADRRGIVADRPASGPGFFSNQRRLLLIHIPSLAGAAPSAVLETPLSGYIEQPMCPSPGYPPDPNRAEARPARAPRNGEIRLAGVVSDEDAARIACLP